jgi:hypothetical protein
MAQLIEKIKDFFLCYPCPPAIFQVSSTYISGIHLEVKEKKLKYYGVVPLAPGLVDPHFDRKNLADGPTLSGLLGEGLKGLHLSRERAACLIPESCFKIFVLSFDSFPNAERERDQLLRWRIKKQMPVMPEDVRLSYEVTALGASVKVLVSLARTAILQEYEDLFAGLGLRVGILTAPTLSLLNLVDWETEKDFIVANIEEDSISLAAVTQSEITLYRLKPLALERLGPVEPGQKIETIVKEIENTVHFIEDREKRGIRSLWMRVGLTDDQEEITSELAGRLPLSIKKIESPRMAELPASKKALFAPLAGQIS